MDTMYMNEVNSDLRVYLFDFLTQNEQGEDVDNDFVSYDDVKIDKYSLKFTANYYHSNIVKVHAWFDTNSRQWLCNLGQIGLNCFGYNNVVLNAGNAIYCMHIVKMINLLSTVLFKDNESTYKIVHGDLQSAVISIFDEHGRTYYGSVNIRSLIDAKNENQVVYTGNLTMATIHYVYLWSKSQYKNIVGVTNADIATYAWDMWQYIKIRNGRFLPCELACWQV